MPDDLTRKVCIACEGGVAPLNKIEAEILLRQIPDWQLSPDASTISCGYHFKDFVDAMAFANQIAKLAEQEGHHPDLTVSWGKVGITLTTHAISGLSENDFILAVKIAALQK